MSLPRPSDEAIAHSDRFTALLRADIENAGPLSFERYMEKVLYTPGFGYYAAGAHKIGSAGDFVTAPEISPLFAACIARQAIPILACVSSPCVLEIGAGTGQFAADFLMHCDPDVYYILEPSPDLRERQQTLLHATHPDKNICWLDCLPETPIEGLIFANEVIDAMPVVSLTRENGVWYENHVAWSGKQFAWQRVPAARSLIDEASLLSWPDNYTSEINRWVGPWLASLSAVLARGAVLLIDYGFPQAEYYHPDRSMGTLMCHYRHHAHMDPFFYPGLQDITAHVNFTHVALQAEHAGFTLAGFTTQAAFLLALGIESMMPGEITPHSMALSKAVQTLLFPHQMGELFKVMALEKNLTIDWQGFSLKDDVHRL